jgi:hypothetical protein
MYCWYGNIDSYDTHLRGENDDDLYIPEEAREAVEEEYWISN